MPSRALSKGKLRIFRNSRANPPLSFIAYERKEGIRLKEGGEKMKTGKNFFHENA